MPLLPSLLVGERGADLRTLDDEGDDSPESEFFRDIRRGMAKMERSVTRRRTVRGRERRAREGKILAAGSPPLGYLYNADKTNFVVDGERAALVRRIFRLIAEEGYSIHAVKKTLEREGIETPKGGRFWNRPVIRDMLFNDLYKPHDRAALEAMVARGQMTREIFERTVQVAPADSGRWGIWFYGRDKTTRTGRLTASGGPGRKFTSRPEEELIAVPVPDIGVPAEHVEGAREATRDNRAHSSAGHRVWELSGGVGVCACGRRLSTHRTKRPHGTYHNYVCSQIRKHGSGACEHGRYHRAETTEERVRGFVRGLLRNPEVLREKVLAGIERERGGLGSVEDEEKHLHANLQGVREERQGYVRLTARGRITDAELDGHLAETDERVRALEEALFALAGRREQAESLDRWAATADEYIRDLVHLASRIRAIREYETVPDERTPENPQGIYRLTPDRIRWLDEEELDAEHREVRRASGERWRGLYAMLGLTVTAHRDGTLVVEWAAGAAKRTLRPGEPSPPPGPEELPGPGSTLVLSQESDSQR